MNGENRLLITNEPVEFDKEPLEVQDSKKFPIIIEESMKYTSK